MKEQLKGKVIGQDEAIIKLAKQFNAHVLD